MRADTKTFCCLIKGYANAGVFHKVDSVVKLANEMEIHENTSFYNAMLYACGKEGDLMKMEEVFKKMKEEECRPDVVTYSIMVDAYKKEAMDDKVHDLEQERLMICV
ncbi:hypothetical protein L2E82_27855 [Cichorium intybus]|uniref:Uncharacterized protein n=1 Tax=Cichorium intybus TaxID=13427 RepID=A0ACB9CU60_CICIN|nr:hypothetical protein L2E82_27855 [Cichorium intybus]